MKFLINAILCYFFLANSFATRLIVDQPGDLEKAIDSGDAKLVETMLESVQLGSDEIMSIIVKKEVFLHALKKGNFEIVKALVRLGVTGGDSEAILNATKNKEILDFLIAQGIIWSKSTLLSSIDNLLILSLYQEKKAREGHRIALGLSA